MTFKEKPKVITWPEFDAQNLLGRELTVRYETLVQRGLITKVTGSGRDGSVMFSLEHGSEAFAKNFEKYPDSEWRLCKALPEYVRCKPGEPPEVYPDGTIKLGVFPTRCITIAPMGVAAGK